MGKSYNGHKSWAHWNVALWLFNDEVMYRHIKVLLSARTKDEVARRLLAELPAQTPDGAKYTFTTVRAALVGE
jgi:endonuclease III